MREDAGQQRDFFEASARGMQQNGVRQTNQRAVLTLVALNAGISNAELARRSGLAPQTVSAILVDLEEASLIVRGEVLRGRRGQPATPYFLHPGGAFSLGCEIGWRHIEVTLLNLGSQVIAHYRRDYDYPDAQTIFTELAGVTAEQVKRLTDAERSRLIGMGLAAPNGIGRNINLLTNSPEQPALWQQIDLQAAVEQAIGLPVQVFNDGSAGCWAELVTHPAPRPSNFAYVQIGTFVGAGIASENVLWQGPNGSSANLGSMLVTDRRGELNFVHLLASIYALEHRLAAAGIAVPKTTPMSWPWDEWEPHVNEWIEDGARAIAQAILNTAAVVYFGTAIIDGTLPRPVLDRLIAATRAQMAQMPTLTFDPPNLAAGNLGGAAAAIGAAQLPLYRRFFSRDFNHMAD